MVPNFCTVFPRSASCQNRPWWWWSLAPRLFPIHQVSHPSASFPSLVSVCSVPTNPRLLSKLLSIFSQSENLPSAFDRPRTGFSVVFISWFSLGSVSLMDVGSRKLLSSPPSDVYCLHGLHQFLDSHSFLLNWEHSCFLNCVIVIALILY